MRNILFGILCVMPLVVVAGDLEEGIQAFSQQKFSLALSKLEPLANNGNDRAQVYMGIMHFNGQGVAENLDRAYAWFLHAASAGNAEGQYQLAYLYNFGFGIPATEKHPDSQAVRWYEAAAKQGHLEAQYNLGLLYLAGTGVEADQEQGMAWIRRAAAAGHADAKAFIGSD